MRVKPALAQLVVWWWNWSRVVSEERRNVENVISCAGPPQSKSERRGTEQGACTIDGTRAPGTRGIDKFSFTAALAAQRL